MTEENSTVGLAKKIAIVFASILFGILGSLALVLELQEEEPIKVDNEELSKIFLNKNIPIIDIRTQKDWETTAVLKNSMLITFFKNDGRYNKNLFIRKLNTKLDKDSTFAILSRKGNKSLEVARILKAEGYENVINLEGGIMQGIKNKVELINYHN